MPDINLYDIEMSRSRLFGNTTYGLIYTKFTVRRLEYPYSTNCRNYIEERKDKYDVLSEFGCIAKCKKKFWMQKEGYACVPMDLNFIMESEDQLFKVCNCTVRPCDKTLQHCEKCPEADEDEYKSYLETCEAECLEDCYEEFYQKDMFELKDDFRDVIWQKYEIHPEKLSNNQTLIFMAAKYAEEVSYTHTPKTSEFDFFAALGGLFSLWIGASILTIYDVGVFLVKFGIHVKSNIDKGKHMLNTRFSKRIKIPREDTRRNQLYDDLTRMRGTPTDFGKLF